MQKIKVMVLAASIMMSASAMAEVDMSCVETPDNANAPLNIGGFDRQANMTKGYELVDNPAATLFACFSMAADMNPKSVVSDRCGCLAAIKKVCKFDWRKGSLRVSASDGANAGWCMPFKFLAGG